MNNEFLSAVILLTLVADPFGNMPLVNAMLGGVPEARRRLVVVRECLIAYGLLLVFMFGGHGFLALMHLSQTSLSIAGGVILFMIAIRMVFAKLDGTFGEKAGSEPFIVPLATPLIAGPSALATVMLMASRDPDKVGMWAAAITVTMVITTVVLLAGTRLHRWLGEHAMHAIERLMGLILTAIAVEMLLAGIRDFIKGL
ncbi:MAG TPA: MarC family protein [Usitatibacteraceae bacterium]|jgi:MarC family membrane protein|nr:MarC family protein [Usitatibacteraceae bacterium]